MPHRLEVGAVWEVTQPTGLAGHSNYDGHLSAHVLPQGEKVILVEIPIFQPQNIPICQGPRYPRTKDFNIH
jgi:hypothetical protein